jgi:putative FmdB family regulatory protein
MPFYEYECTGCRFYVEVMQKISDARLRKCPSCGRNTLKKLISAPVFRLKGAGWYETDFKSDKENKRNLADREDKAQKAEQAPKPEAKTDARTESAAPARAPAAPRAARRTKARPAPRAAKPARAVRRHK